MQQVIQTDEVIWSDVCKIRTFWQQKLCPTAWCHMQSVKYRTGYARHINNMDNSASPRASLAASSGTDNIPSLRSDTPLPQRISAGIPRREHPSDSRRGKPPSSTVVHNNNACRSAGAEIYPDGWSCFPRRCTACMEQSTTISSNCFLPRSIQTPAEDISIRPRFWLTFTNLSFVIIL